MYFLNHGSSTMYFKRFCACAYAEADNIILDFMSGEHCSAFCITGKFLTF